MPSNKISSIIRYWLYIAPQTLRKTITISNLFRSFCKTDRQKVATGTVANSLYFDDRYVAGRTLHNTIIAYHFL